MYLFCLCSFCKNKSVCSWIKSNGEAKVSLTHTLQAVNSEGGTVARNRPISCLSTCNPSNTDKQGERIVFWIQQVTGRSWLLKNTCKYHLFSQAHLSISQRYPFHTCLRAFAFRNPPAEAQRWHQGRLRGDGCGVVEKKTWSIRRVCLWYLIKAFLVWQNYLWHPFPYIFTFYLCKKQSLCFAASSCSWEGCTGILEHLWRRKCKRSVEPEVLSCRRGNLFLGRD